MKNFANSRVGAVVIGASVLVAAGGTGAFAASMVTSSQIKDGTVRSRDIATSKQDNSTIGVRQDNLSSYLQNQVKSIGGKADKSYVDSQDKNLQGQVKGTLKNPYANGPYPGSTQLQHGDNSKEIVPADGQRHTVWVSCGGNDVATGGGFRKASDSTTDAAKAIDVIASEPSQYDQSTKQLTYNPIQGDPDGSFVPNAWAVEVVNNGDSPQTVRPWIICTPTN